LENEVLKKEWCCMKRAVKGWFDMDEMDYGVAG